MADPKFGHCQAEATLRQKGGRHEDSGGKILLVIELGGKPLKESSTQDPKGTTQNEGLRKKL